MTTILSSFHACTATKRIVLLLIVTVPAIWGFAQQTYDIAYTNAEGITDTHSATPLDGSETRLNAGWYYVGSDISFDHTIYLQSGEVNIILCDNMTMNIGTDAYRLKTSCIDGGTNGSLTIYGQSGQSGQINAYAIGTEAVVSVKNLNINGGNIFADGENATVIKTGGNMNVNRGTVNVYATGTSSAIYNDLSRYVTVNGGYLNVTSEGGHAIESDVVFNGGHLTAIADDNHYGILRNATLCWNDPNDRFLESSCKGTVSIVNNCIFTDEEGNIYSGTQTLSQKNAFNGKTLIGTNLLLDDEDNDIDAFANAFGGNATNITLYGRTIYRDGNWNTLCLPFSVGDGDEDDGVSFSGTPLQGATLMELDTSNLENYTHVTGVEGNTLYLNFKPADAIVAGRPYFIKWTEEASPIQGPTFCWVTFDNSYTATARMTVNSEDNGSELGNMSLIGIYSPTEIFTEEKSNLYLEGGNTLYYPWDTDMSSFKVNAFRAYIRLNNGFTAGEPIEPGQQQVNAFFMNFGNDDVTTAIKNVQEPTANHQCSMVNGQCSMVNGQSGIWFTLDGIKLKVKPTARGIYIYNGRKVIL